MRGLHEVILKLLKCGTFKISSPAVANETETCPTSNHLIVFVNNVHREPFLHEMFSHICIDTMSSRYHEQLKKLNNQKSELINM